MEISLEVDCPHCNKRFEVMLGLEAWDSQVKKVDKFERETDTTKVSEDGGIPF